jgi:hypothetical protein
MFNIYLFFRAWGCSKFSEIPILEQPPRAANIVIIINIYLLFRAWGCSKFSETPILEQPPGRSVAAPIRRPDLSLVVQPRTHLIAS